jgi:Flp pilus assembly protein TadG
MAFGSKLRQLTAKVRAYLRANRANVATIFAIAIVPVTVAAGAGLDLSRAMVVRERLTQALDAAALAVGGTTGLTQSQMQTLAQQYFNANYTADPSLGTPAAVGITISGQSVTLTSNVPVPTTLLNFVHINTVNVASSSEVVWGQSKLWVSLVLDNTGSMTETDSTGTSKISALKTATLQLLTLLQNAATTAGDVEVALVPFAKDVNAGTSYVAATWVDWTDWAAAPVNSTPSFSTGPGSLCPYSSSSNGFSCTSNPTNGSSSVSTIPSSGTYKGYICPSADNGNVSGGLGGHYYNGCYNSTAATQTSTSTGTITTNQVCSKTGSNSATQCTCSGYPTTNTSTSGNTTTVTTTTCGCTSSGSGNNKKTTCTSTATPAITTTTNGYDHSWIANAHSTWAGCMEDRTQDYDTTNTTPSASGTLFPAENSQYCPPATFTALTDNWTLLQTQVNTMTANGNTNQTIGLAWGWQALTQGDPLDPPALPANTQQVIILLSDGLNTQNRYSATQSAIDAREALACSNAKAAGIIIYTVFVDLNGTQGSSAALQSCATDTAHYFDLTTSGAIVTTFAQIGEEITNLRVNK